MLLLRGLYLYIFVRVNKQRISILLMVITILAICGFQVFWLKKNYTEELRQFRINQNILFRETIFRLQVSKLNLDSNVDIKTEEKQGIVSMTNILQQEIRSEPDSNRHRRVVISTNHHGKESIDSINRYYVNVKAEDNL
ncbi:MAG TPA: hypothetical protein VFV08_16935, partial [Puia sp.]|nr:hypothetical protein [Puia sp.]